MGEIYNKFNIDIDIIKTKNMPIICCIPIQEIEHKFTDYTTVNLGLELSNRLKKIPKKKEVNKIKYELN